MGVLTAGRNTRDLAIYTDIPRCNVGFYGPLVLLHSYTETFCFLGGSVLSWYIEFKKRL